MRERKIWIPLFLAPTVILFVLIYAAPMLMVFITSLFDYRLTGGGLTFVGLANYVRMVNEIAFWRGLQNTVIWIVLQCTLHVGLGVLVALLLYKRPRGWRFIHTAYMVPSIISNAAMAMIFLNVFNPKFGLLNMLLQRVGLGQLTHNWLMETATAFPSVTLVWILFSGYTTTLVLSEALSIEPTILEAARMDGASDLQMDLLVVVPLLRRIIGAAMIMGATYMLQMFDLIYITTNGGPGRATTNLPLLLYSVFESENNYGYASTVGVCIVVLGLVSIVVITKLMGLGKED